MAGQHESRRGDVRVERDHGAAQRATPRRRVQLVERPRRAVRQIVDGHDDLQARLPGAEADGGAA